MPPPGASGSRPIGTPGPAAAGSGAVGPRRPTDGRRPEPGSPARGTRTVPPPLAPRNARRRLVLKRVDPWSVFTTTLLYATFIAVVIVVAVYVLFVLLDNLGVLDSIDDLGRTLNLLEPDQVLVPQGQVLTLSIVLALVNVVLLTVLATLAAFLYNLCASFTGGVELTLSERD